MKFAKQFRLRTLFLLTLIAAVAAYMMRPFQLDVDFRLVNFTTEYDQSSNEQYLAAQVEITNNSSHAIWYQANAEGFPNFSTESKIDDTWNWNGHMTNPLQWFKFKKGRTIHFSAPVFVDSTAIKVGTRFNSRRNGSEFDVWSDEWEVTHGQSER